MFGLKAMAFLTKQKLLLESGDSSTSLLAGRDVVINGLTYSDARQLFVDLYDQNVQRLTAEASRLAADRVEVFATNFLLQLTERNPQAINALADPDVYQDILSAQRHYAASGDDDLGEVLVNLLVNRAGYSLEKFSKVVLGAALDIAPLLTAEHWNALSLIFSVRELLPRQTSVATVEDLGKFAAATIRPLTSSIPRTASHFRHILYTGCGTATSHESLARLLGDKLPWLFSGPVRLFDVMLVHPAASSLLETCATDPSAMQFSRETYADLTTVAQAAGIPGGCFSALRHLMDEGRISEAACRSRLKRYIPDIEELDAIWSNTPSSETVLTPVGIAIALANIQRALNQRYELVNWFE